MKRMLTRAVAIGFALWLLAATPAFARVATKFTSVYATSVWQHYDSVPKMRAVLKTSGGTALRYKTVWLYCNGDRTGSARTDRYGRVTFTLAMRNSDIQAYWYLRYAGSSTYHAARSTKVATTVDLHLLAIGLEPVWDEPSGEWVVTTRIRLRAGESYWLYTTHPTWRSVRVADTDANLYPSAEPVQGGSFSVSDEAFYDVRLRCADDSGVSVLLY